MNEKSFKRIVKFFKLLLLLVFAIFLLYHLPKNRREPLPPEAILYQKAQDLSLKENPDPQKIFALYKEAADIGHAESQVKTGEALFYGLGVLKNPETAFDYYQKAALQNNPEAYFQLGMMYEHGYQLLVPLEKAVEYFQRAGELGLSEGWFRAGMLVFDDKNMPQSLRIEKAEAYFRRAALAGHEKAKELLSKNVPLFDNYRNYRR